MQFNLENYPNFFGSIGAHSSFILKSDVEQKLKDFHNGMFTRLTNGDFKVFHIDRYLENILIKTKNQVGYRKTPFQFIFMECELVFGGKRNLRGVSMDKRIVSGIALMSGDYNEQSSGGEYKNASQIIISAIVRLGEEGDLGHYVSWMDEKAERDDNHEIFSEKEDEEIKMFVCNFLDFMNHPEVETRIVKYPKEMNETRIKKGKTWISDTVETIINGKLFRYIYETLPKSAKNKSLNSFWVRGHYIHFWDKNHWNSIYSLENEELKMKGYYLDKRGIVCKWIYPYIKGEGLLKEKIRKVRKPIESTHIIDCENSEVDNG